MITTFGKIYYNRSFRKIIEIPIVEEDTYEKNIVLYCSIGEPRHIAGKELLIELTKSQTNRFLKREKLSWRRRLFLIALKGMDLGEVERDVFERLGLSCKQTHTNNYPLLADLTLEIRL